MAAGELESGFLWFGIARVGIAEVMARGYGQTQLHSSLIQNAPVAGGDSNVFRRTAGTGRPKPLNLLLLTAVVGLQVLNHAPLLAASGCTRSEYTAGLSSDSFF